MVLARRGWILSTGLLLAASTGRLALAQDYGKAPTVLPSRLPVNEAPAAGGVVLPGGSETVLPAPVPESILGGHLSGWDDRKELGCTSASSCGRCGSGHAGRYEVPPLGAFLYAHGRTQVANGEAARMVLYEYDFVEGTGRLNARGKDQLARIAALLPVNFAPVVIERTAAGPEFDEVRRQAVLEELLRGPFPIPMERVVVGEPMSRGLRGVEAELIYQNLMLQTQTRGILGNLGSNISYPGGPNDTSLSGSDRTPRPMPR